MRKVLGFLAVLLLGIPALAWSASFTLTPSPTDQSVEFLSYVFGVVNGVLHGSGSQIMGRMFAQFNSAVLALGGVVLVYTTIMGIMNTAQEGEFLGKKFSSVFVPFRTLLGILLIAPTSTGYSWIQVFVIWIVLQGVGAANAVWGAAVNYLFDGGAIISQGTDITQSPMANAVRKQLPNLASATACLNVLQSAINQTTFSNPSLTPPKQQALASVIEAIDPNASKAINTVSMPNFADDDKPWVGLNGICGTITDIAQGKNADQDAGGGTISASGADGYVALRQVIMDMAAGTQYVVGNVCDAKCYTPQLDPQGHPIPGQYITTPCPAGTYIPSSGGSCSGSAVCTPNGVPGNNTQPNNFFYFSTYSLSSPIMSWCNKIDFTAMPNLNQTFNTALLDYVGLRFNNSAVDAPIPFFPQVDMHQVRMQQAAQMREDGWFNAGKYYFALAAINSGAQYGSATNDSGFTIVPPKPSTLGSCSSQASNDFSMDDHFIDCYLKNAPSSTTLGSDDVVSLDTYKNNFYTWLLPFFGRESAGGSSVFHNTLIGDFISGQMQSRNYGTVGAVDEGHYGGGPGGYGAIIIDGMITSGQDMHDDIVSLQNDQRDGMNPVILMMNFGSAMMNTAMNLWITLAAIMTGITFALGAAISFTFTSAVVAFVTMITPLVTAILVPMIVAGAMLSYYMPMVPFMIFSFGVIGWIIGVIEAMIAAPIVGFGILNPEGHDLWGKSDPAVMLLLNLFLRPSLMIFGLISGIMISYIGIWIINNGIGSVNSVISDTVGGWAGGVIYGVAMPLIYMVMAMQIINKSFTLIYFFPDRITRWLSGGLQESLGSEMSGLERDVRGSVQSGAGKVAEGGVGGITRAQGDNAGRARQEGAQKKRDQKNKGEGGNPTVS